MWWPPSDLMFLGAAYYVLRGKTIIVMLGGGDKSSQDNDIKEARKLAKLLED